MNQLEQDTLVLLAEQGEQLRAMAGLLAEIVGAVGGLDLSPAITVSPASVVVGEGDGAAAAAAVRDALSPLLVSLATAVEHLGLKLDEVAKKMIKGPPVVTRGGGTNKVQMIDSTGTPIEGLPVTGSVEVPGSATEATLLDVKRGLSDQDTRLDYDGANNLIYSGKAVAGSGPGQSNWTIQKLSYTGGNLVLVQVRSGLAWDDRTVGW